MRSVLAAGALVAALVLAAPAAAATTTRTYHASLASGSVSGTVTVTITGSSGTLSESLRGLPARSMSVVWLRSGSCSTTGFLVVRQRWTASSSGRVSITVPLTTSMVQWFTYDWSHRGGVHAHLTDGSISVCAALHAG